MSEGIPTTPQLLARMAQAVQVKVKGLIGWREINTKYDYINDGDDVFKYTIITEHEVIEIVAKISARRERINGIEPTKQEKAGF